jgi:predicted ATPase
VRGWALVVQGQGKEGVRQMDLGLRAAERIGIAVFHSYYLVRLAGRPRYVEVGTGHRGRRVVAQP